ncbi:hypothetical protein BGZ73_006042 [Actinomortierella ambigua]|nr:hypothetical protein BGZ73_006042 [Actinomortierella ambigua]
MQKEHPVVVTSPPDEDPQAHHSDSDYSLGTDDSPHSVDSYQLSAEDDDADNVHPDDNVEHGDNHDIHTTPPLHKAQTSPAISSISTRDLDGDVDDFFLVELERRSPSPRLVHDNQYAQAPEKEQEQEQTQEQDHKYKHEQPPQVQPLERHEQAHEQVCISDHQERSTDDLPLPSSLELVFPTLTVPQSPHASLSPPQHKQEEKGGEMRQEEEREEEDTRTTKTETAVPFDKNALEEPRTVQLVPPQNKGESSSSNETAHDATTTLPSALIETDTSSLAFSATIAPIATTTLDGDKKRSNKEIQRGGILPPPVHTGAWSSATATSTSASASVSPDNSSGSSDNNKKENGPERGSPGPSSNQSRPRSSSLISGASRSPRTPKSVAFAPDVKESPEERGAAASDDAGSSDTSSGDEGGEGKELPPQEYQVLLLGTARNTQDIAKTCTKIRTDLRRLSRHTVVKFTTCFDRPVDKNELGEYDLCVYFIQALGAQPQDAELLLEIVQRTATLVIISSHNTMSLSRQASIDTRRHLGVYLNKAMPRLPIFRNPFRTARLSQDYESDAELILRNAVSLKELPRINIAILLNSVLRDPTSAQFASSWDWQDRLPSLKLLLLGLLLFFCVPYLAYGGFRHLTRPKPPAHALLSNLSYDLKHGFATCSLDLKTASGRPYRSKEHHLFAIRVLTTESPVSVESSETFQYRMPEVVHHTFPGENKQVLLVNIRGMGLDACHSDVPSLFLHIWFQNGTRVPGTPVKLALPDEQKNCPTPPPLPPVAVVHEDEAPTVWEKVQRVVTSNVPFSQSTAKKPTTTGTSTNTEHHQDNNWFRYEQQTKPHQSGGKKTDQSRKKQQKQQKQQQRRWQQPVEDDYDFPWTVGGDWTAQWNRISSVMSQQLQGTEVSKYVRLMMDGMLGAFHDMYQFCQSASYVLMDALEDAKESMEHFIHDLCDDTHPIIKQVRRGSHKYKKAVRQQFRGYYNQFRAKFEKPGFDKRLNRMVREHVDAAKRLVEQRLPVGRLADVMDQAVFEANLRAQTLMAGSVRDMAEQWKKVQMFEQRLAAVERRMADDPMYARMDGRTKRKHAIRVMVLQGFWVPETEDYTPPIIQHGKEQWRMWRRRFAI